jgi:hypothetical protein
LEPRNGYGWAQMLQMHSIAKDEAAVRSDLRALARSTYYEDGLLAARRAMLATVLHSGPDDAAMAGALGRQLLRAQPMATEDLENSVHRLCALNWGAPGNPLWLDQHDEARSDCRATAVLLAQWGSGWQRFWAWRWLDKDQSSPRTQAGVLSASEWMQRRWYVGNTPVGEHGWRPWTDDEWLAWARARQAAN